MAKRKFDSNTFFLTKPSAAVIITPAQDVVNGDEKSVRSGTGKSGGGDWVKWGANDDEPNKVIALNWESPSKPSLLDQAKEFVLGAGVAPFRKRFEEGKVIYEREEFEEITTWFEDNEIFERYVELAALSMVFCEMAPVNISIQPGNLVDLQAIQPLKFRYEPAAAGKPLTHALINPNFGTDKAKSSKSITRLPLFDLKQPDAFAESIMVLKKAQIGQDFYRLGLFWGTGWWTKVANKVPLYHFNGLENGYNIKYTIEIEEAYFILEGEDPNDEETFKAIEARKDKFMDKLDDFLAGVENADKAVVMIGELTDATGKSKSMIRINPIDNKMTDDAYTKIYREASVAQAQGHGILPVLAGIDTGSKLGGSGSELEHAAMYQVAYRTPSYRRLLVKPLNIALKLMKLDRDGGEGRIEFKFVDVEFTTLDKNPTGKQNVVGQAS